MGVKKESRIKEKKIIYCATYGFEIFEEECKGCETPKYLKVPREKCPMRG
jgi:hypothetical protein